MNRSFFVSSSEMTFGCLTLPAMFAKQMARDIGGMFWLAPVVAVAGVLPGLFVAHLYDLPPGQVVVAVLGLLVLSAGLLRRTRTLVWAE